MSKSDVFVGRYREGAFNIITSADTTSSDQNAMSLEISLIESGAIYYGKFSDAQLSKACLDSTIWRTMCVWFSDLEVFMKPADESAVVFLMENQIVKIIVTVEKINITSTVRKKRRHATNARISEWSDEEGSKCSPPTSEIQEDAEFIELKRRYPYIDVELPITSPTLKKLRVYDSSNDSEHETSSSDCE